MSDLIDMAPIERWLGDREQRIDVFVGPCNATVNGTPYVTITSYGLKAEGSPAYSEPTIWTAAEAIYRFRQELQKMVEQVQPQQFAWRRRPALEVGDDGDFCVSARFALLMCKSGQA